MPIDVDFSLQLAYAASSGTINEFGTGLGGLPGTTVEDMFVSFGEKGAVEVYEICRILGPFPSVRNKLDGTFEFKKKAAGFAGEAVSEEGLYMKYTQLTDGRDKVRLSLGHQHILGPAFAPFRPRAFHSLRKCALPRPFPAIFRIPTFSLLLPLAYR